MCDARKPAVGLIHGGNQRVQRTPCGAARQGVRAIARGVRIVERIRGGSTALQLGALYSRRGEKPGAGLRSPRQPASMLQAPELPPTPPPPPLLLAGLSCMQVAAVAWWLLQAAAAAAAAAEVSAEAENCADAAAPRMGRGSDQ